jgi:hypothetical protein
MPDLLVTRARQTGATVTVIEDSALLEPVGGVGGFLRWRERFDDGRGRQTNLRRVSLRFCI